MRVRLHIDALAIEADWTRRVRSDFAEQFEERLSERLVEICGSSHFSAGADERRVINLRDALPARPRRAGATLADLVASAIGETGRGSSSRHSSIVNTRPRSGGWGSGR